MAARTYTVCFASIQALDLFAHSVDVATLREPILESWDVDSTIQRYRREWHISEFIILSETTLAGELGFVTEAENNTLTWDKQRHRFVRGNAPSGTISPFVIDTTTGVCIFQVRPGHIRPTSFTNALEAVLDANGAHKWRVLPLAEVFQFETWLRTVRRITDFSFRLQRPNPNWAGRPRIEEIVDGLHLEVASLKGKALDGEAINIAEPIFQQALDHVRREYGAGRVGAEDIAGGRD